MTTIGTEAVDDPLHGQRIEEIKSLLHQALEGLDVVQAHPGNSQTAWASVGRFLKVATGCYRETDRVRNASKGKST